MKTSHDICRRAAADTDEVFGRKLDLKADFSGADIDFFEIFRGYVQECRELFFHSDRRAAAVDIAGERKKLLLFYHFDRFFT